MPFPLLFASGEGGVAPIYKTYLVTKTGTQTVELDANVMSIEWELNGPGSASVQMHVEDTDAQQVDALADEIQVWRNGVPIFWGPVVRAEANANTVTFQCSGLLYYFDRRFFGRADRTNLLSNPEFESDGSGWSATLATASYVTSRRVLGTKSAKLVYASAGADAFLSQSFNETGSGVGTLLTLAGWFFVDDAGFLGGALDNRGLFVEMKNGSTVEQYDFAVIDSETPRNVWQRAETTVWVPPNVTRTINVRLYAPGGTIYWDALSVTRMESLSFYATDQADICRQIVDYAQDNHAFTHNKSDLLIAATATSCPATGVTRDYHQQFAEHANIGQALKAFADLDDGVDISVEFTAATRTFHTWYPQKGTDRGATPGSGVTTVTIEDVDLAEGPFGWRFDGDQAASQVTYIGDGDGPDREEGGAEDLTAFGSTTYEYVAVAETGTAIDRLDSLATEALRALKNPESVTFTVQETAQNLLETVRVGDTIDVNITHGYIQAVGDYRIVALKLNPTKDALTFECNPT